MVEFRLGTVGGRAAGVTLDRNCELALTRVGEAATPTALAAVVALLERAREALMRRCGTVGPAPPLALVTSRSAGVAAPRGAW